LLGVAAVCALALGRQGVATSAAATVEPESGLVRANAESKFPWGFDIEEMCGVDYKIQETMHSNLGGQGPDSGAEGIVYRTSESIDHKYIRDIIVEINAVSPYHSASAHLNGRSHDFGAIHVDAGKHVDMKVSFQNMDREPIELETFRMTFYDLDEAPHHSSQEYIIAEGHPRTQRDHHTDVAERHVHGDIEFLATEVGTGKDNPDDSSDLTKQQKDRSVVLTYHHKKQFDLTLGSHNGHSPRAFEFALHSALSCHKEKVAKTSTTITTTVTTTTIDPAILAGQQRAIGLGLGVVALLAAGGVLLFWATKRQEREIAYFEGTS